MFLYSFLYILLPYVLAYFYLHLESWWYVLWGFLLCSIPQLSDTSCLLTGWILKNSNGLRYRIQLISIDSRPIRLACDLFIGLLLKCFRPSFCRSYSPQVFFVSPNSGNLFLFLPAFLLFEVGGGGVFSMRWKNENVYILVRKLKGRDHLEDLDVNGGAGGWYWNWP
jgi:hypothetical protein